MKYQLLDNPKVIAFGVSYTTSNKQLIFVFYKYALVVEF
jgi:hypothetical protein